MPQSAERIPHGSCNTPLNPFEESTRLLSHSEQIDFFVTLNVTRYKMVLFSANLKTLDLRFSNDFFAVNLLAGLYIISIVYFYCVLFVSSLFTTGPFFGAIFMESSDITDDP